MDDNKDKGKAQANKYEETKAKDTSDPKKFTEKDAGKSDSN